MPFIVFRPYPVLTVFSVLALALLLSLGQWQLERRIWKLDLIEKLEARPALPAVPLHTLERDGLGDIASLEYRPVTLSGAFDHGAEMPVFGHVGAGQPGYFIITPLKRDGAPPVLVNRGFVPMAFRDPATRAAGQVTGRVTLTGLIRSPGRKGSFTPDNDPAAAQWYWRDWPAMAAWANVPDALPLFVDARESATPPGGMPRGGASVTMPRNNHLGYAVTWFGFALCLIGVYGAYHAAHGRLGWRGR
ncbi:MAG: SURF1 family protein [Alphaproteobacteria bacterium]